MRFVQLLDNFGPAGGLERFVYNLTAKFKEKGHDTVIVTLNRSTTQEWGNSSHEQLQLDDDPRTWVRSISVLRPDLIVWHGTPGLIPLIFRLNGMYPTVATIHGVMCPSGSRLFSDTDEVCRRQSGIGCLPIWYLRHCGYGKSPMSAASGFRTHFQMLKALKTCERVYAVSEWVKNSLTAEGISSDSVYVFDNTIGILESSRRAALIPWSRDKPLNLVYVGRLVYAKGVQYLIKAVRAFVEREESVRCTIVGEGPYWNALTTLVNELGLDDYVTFLGRVPGKDIEAVYAAADVVVVPSIWPEPAGLVVAEARAAGKRVVVSDVGGLPEWAQLMSGVFVAKSANPESLREAILHATIQPSNLPFRPAQDLTRFDLVKQCESLVRSM